MRVKPGQVINFKPNKCTVMFTIKPNGFYIQGRCLLADCESGHLKWVDKLDFPEAILLKEFPNYVEISQHNYKDNYNRITHKCPKDIHEAREWAETKGHIWFSPRKRTVFGYYTYKVEPDGSLVLVCADLDSSD